MTLPEAIAMVRAQTIENGQFAAPRITFTAFELVLEAAERLTLDETEKHDAG